MAALIRRHRRGTLVRLLLRIFATPGANFATPGANPATQHLVLLRVSFPISGINAHIWGSVVRHIRCEIRTRCCVLASPCRQIGGHHATGFAPNRSDSRASAGRRETCSSTYDKPSRDRSRRRRGSHAAFEDRNQNERKCLWTRRTISSEFRTSGIVRNSPARAPLDRNKWGPSRMRREPAWRMNAACL